MSINGLSFEEFKSQVLADYRLCYVSRQLSLTGRKEVFSGKAKFGIFGDGKEVAQVALAKQFKKGDWRSGYYRDQTFMLATGMLTPKEFFALLYGETRAELNPHNAGRSFNNHFGTRLVDAGGKWKNQVNSSNSASDISPTAGQMPRMVGLALASKLYRNNPLLKNNNGFSRDGNEVVFGFIGDGSTSEGHFFETMNVAGILQVPMTVSVWDDGFAISVPTRMQTIKASISKALKGFEKQPGDDTGILIYKAKGWDYPGLCKLYEEVVGRCREEHVPVLVHVEELTQPTGHSTSGSAERYKSAERVKWEKENDCLVRMRQWVEATNIATAKELDNIEAEARAEVKKARIEAYAEFMQPILQERNELIKLVSNRRCACSTANLHLIDDTINSLQNVLVLNRKEIYSAARKLLRGVCASCDFPGELKHDLRLWLKGYNELGHEKYNKYLHDETESSSLKVSAVAPLYGSGNETLPGKDILLQNFDAQLSKEPRLVVFGEDIGKLGGVNQSLDGMQGKYGELRVFDTGICETTIVGKAIGLALRGLRPIAEIQYFDYLLYALQILSDDVATLHYRTKGGQKVPLIISTRGHRLEGPWHAGSPLSMVINSVRGIYLCVPRDMTRAAGFYNTLLLGDDPALVIEPLNGYRAREPKPENPGEYRIPLGVPEILHPGLDVTLVTYGACVKIGMEAVHQLSAVGISVELIDVQTLLPFDTGHVIVESIKKTNRVVFFDEDVPGGATAYMMQKVLEEQEAFYHLDAPPVTVSAKDHKPAYGTDGDYFTKPSVEDVFEAVYALMSQSAPAKYPPLY